LISGLGFKVIENDLFEADTIIIGIISFFLLFFSLGPSFFAQLLLIEIASLIIHERVVMPGFLILRCSNCGFLTVTDDILEYSLTQLLLVDVHGLKLPLTQFQV